MHAYLIYSRKSTSELEEKILEILRKEKSKGLEFGITSINDVKDIEKSVKLQVAEKRTFIIRSIERASLPALNAMLKLLEEPTKNTSFILTTNNLNAIIPTIKSRCQIIVTGSKIQLDKQKGEEIEKFLQMKRGERLLYTENISKREDAIEFLENLITFVESKIEEYKDKTEAARILSFSKNALLAIKSNGNVKLQLTKLIINI